MATDVRFPFGDAKTNVALSATGAQALTISDTFTLIDGVTIEATGNRTLNLTFAADLIPGSRILVRSKTNATETTIFGTGITGATITGVAGTTINAEFVFISAAAGFVQAGAEQQID